MSEPGGRSKLRVAVVGLGPIGQACARNLRADARCELVGVCDSDPAKAGQPLSTWIGPSPGSDDAGDLAVKADVSEFTEGELDVAVVATVSQLDTLAPMLRLLIDRRVAVVTSCEQLVWPWLRHPALAEELDAQARRHGVAIAPAGVNPGFAMDRLGLELSGMVKRVDAITCTRRVDAAQRRAPLQRKIGATLTVDAFSARVAEGRIGHVGLVESLAVVVAGLGGEVRLEAIEHRLEPVIAEQPLHAAIGEIEPGRVAGIHERAMWAGDSLAVTLDLTMAVGVPKPVDRIDIAGPVPLTLKIPGSAPGDSATVAALLNAAPIVAGLSPGLHTPLGLPPAPCRNRR